MSEPTLQRIDIRGADTAYRRAGKGETALYLHGERLAANWLPFHDALARELDVIAPQTPGFGDSPRPNWFEELSDAVLHYDEFIDRLGIGPVHLVGHSLGAWIAARYAVQYPQKIKSLTLIAPMGVRVPGHPFNDIFRLTDEELPNAFVNGDEAAYQTFVLEGEAIETRIVAYGELTTAARLIWNPRYDLKLEERLDRVKCPSLIVAPKDDRIVPAQHFDRWKELLPNATLKVVAGPKNKPTGHYVNVQEPEAVAGAIVEFIRGV